ncbi:MAG: beta-glucosidase [Armatimonadetes bacterium]|nr:beta-glucosidase [Armatimonadota bacterium]
MLTSALIFLAASVSRPPKVPLYRDPQAPVEARVNDLFSRMTQEEKMDILTGTGFTTRPIPRLGVPPMAMADAGQGVRGGMPSTEGPATAFPSGVAMASTWDPELVGRIGKAIGEEALNKGTGVQVLLGPAINIHRSPLGGRNGEYFSEDPFLASRMAVGYIEGMQSTGCAACAKHYIANNEEVDRDYVDVQVSERALREIYMPAFEAAVKEAHVWTVMSSYNMINGYHASANKYLLTDVLKKGWGYDGMVMSDWGGVHETVRTVNAGNDLEMPGPGLLRQEQIEKAMKRGLITQAQLDDNVRRILRTIVRVGLLDGAKTPDHDVVNSAAHQKLTFEAATKGIVLLKNEGGILPLQAKRIKSIAVIGRPASDVQVGANGSPTVTPFYKIQPLEGIKKYADPNTKITYVPASNLGETIPSSALKSSDGQPGLHAEYFSNKTLSGTPVATRTDQTISFTWDGSPANGVGKSDFSVRWTGKLTAPKTGTYNLVLSCDDGCRLFLDGRLLIDHWVDSGETPISTKVDLVAGEPHDLKVEYYQAGGLAVAKLNWTPPQTEAFQDAVAAAKQADVAIVCIGTNGQEGEGNDRPSMELPANQDELIQAVMKANKRTIVVMNNGTPVDMSQWVDKVPGLVETWFPGQEGGAALGAILFGEVNPSGKLPDTLAKRREDYPDFGNFPGTKGTVNYAEGIYVGYRHFDKEKIAPLFPFGFGLSYTSFGYGKASVSEPDDLGNRTVSLNVTNTGKRAGAEVVQLYIHDLAPKIDRPIQELKAFQKVMLEPGETKTVHLTVPPRAFAYCDVPGKQWKADAGRYELEIGASSRDIRQRATVTLGSDFTESIPFMSEQTAPKAATEPDLAKGKPVTASSTENHIDVEAKNAVDGNDQTRWASDFADNQWIAVDLGQPTLIDHVTIKWEAAFASEYAVQVSDDGLAWNDVFSTDAGFGGIDPISFKPVTARYVRLFAKKRGTKYGVSLFSFEVYAPKK